VVVLSSKGAMNDIVTSVESQTNNFSLTGAFSESWTVLKREWKTVVPAFAVSLVSQVVSKIIRDGAGSGTGASIINLVVMLVGLVVTMGVAYVLLQAVRGNKFQLSELSQLSSKIVNYFLTSFLLGLILFFGFLFLIIPGVYFMLKLGYAPLLVIDKGMGPFEALQAASKMSNGVMLKLLGFILLSFGIIVAGALALFVGLLVAIPIVSLAYIVIYNKLVQKLN
jgi:uncharacterized membrane protein